MSPQGCLDPTRVVLIGPAHLAKPLKRGEGRDARGDTLRAAAIRISMRDKGKLRPGQDSRSSLLELFFLKSQKFKTFRHCLLFALELQNFPIPWQARTSQCQSPQAQQSSHLAGSTPHPWNVHTNHTNPYIFFSPDCMKMRSNPILLAACLLPTLCASPIGDPGLQVSLEDLKSSHLQASSQRLHGRFLHITGGRITLSLKLI
jgi:hypothetical protein